MELTTPNLHTSPSTRELSGDTQGGVPDAGCQPPRAIHCLPGSFPRRWRSHPPHLPPPGALLTCWICFPLLSSSSLALPPRSTSRKEQMRPGAPGDCGGLDARARHLSPRRHPPLCHVATCASRVPKIPRETSAASNVRRLSDSCAVTSPPFHPCLPTC